MRPPVSVVVPFAGTREEADATIRGLAELRLRPGDEVLLADDSLDEVVASLSLPPRFRSLATGRARSSYTARNLAAEQAANEWILFLDADCRPAPDLLDRYFAERVPDGCGAVAGGIAGSDEQRSLVARYSASRGVLSQSVALAHDPPFANTANLLVRAQAWRAVAGFEEGIRSGGDADFSWRLQAAGWALSSRPEAVVTHLHRERLRDFVRQFARYGAGQAWLRARHGTSFDAERPAEELLRPLVAAAGWAATGRFERAAFRALDSVRFGATMAGRLFGNRSPQPLEPVDVAVLVDSYPELSETFVANEVAALVRLGLRVRVEAAGRARRPLRAAARVCPVAYGSDDGRAGKLRAFAALAARHPIRCLRDRARRGRWRREEFVPPLPWIAQVADRVARTRAPHLHVHFAGQSALTALRLSSLLGVRYSVTAHGYDIYKLPRNLEEKVERAAFATSGCEYTVRELRRRVSRRAASRVHEIVMGVDVERFARPARPRGGGTVLAVGRLVEKKGFHVLLDAVARLPAGAPLERVVIVGDGPLRERLEEQRRRLRLEDRVVLGGARDHDEVRRLMGEADVFVMPCVVASDGDRDSMPVVVKEAMAMELPVVASDEVGLPELVTPDCGVLVAPGDADALAGGLARVLSLGVEERARMGRAGRERVAAHCDVTTETARLAALIAG